MLVLTRREGQDIIIDDGRIRIIVVGIDTCGQVRVGIEADRSIPVYRGEIYRINQQREKDNASANHQQTTSDRQNILEDGRGTEQDR